MPRSWRLTRCFAMKFQTLDKQASRRRETTLTALRSAA
jgi:hypothetical protein